MKKMRIGISKRTGEGEVPSGEGKERKAMKAGESTTEGGR